jgi:hypothetical protein
MGHELINKIYSIGIIMTVIWGINRKIVDRKYPVGVSRLDTKYPNDGHYSNDCTRETEDA